MVKAEGSPEKPPREWVEDKAAIATWIAFMFVFMGGMVVAMVMFFSRVREIEKVHDVIRASTQRSDHYINERKKDFERERAKLFKKSLKKYRAEMGEEEWAAFMKDVRIWDPESYFEWQEDSK